MGEKGLLLIGCGHMGASLLRGWCADKSLSGPLRVVAPRGEKVEPFLGDPRVQYFPHPSSLKEKPSIVVCALKPSMMASVLPLYRDFMTPDSIFCTVAAALPLSFYRAILGNEATLVRVMPNLPVAVGVGQSLYCGLSLLPSPVQHQVERVFGVLGKVIFVQDEKMLERYTPLVGCGPGFLFKILESVTRAAEGLGGDPEAVKILARDMFIATAKFLEASPKDVSTLRQEVASPHGMTQAGYEVMERCQLDALIEKTLFAAFARARAMEEEYTHAG